MVPHHVARGAPPGHDAMMEHAEAALAEDRLGGITSDVSAPLTEMPTSLVMRPR